LQPILVAVLSGPLLGERFSPRQWLGFALGFLGVGLVVGLEAADRADFVGALWGLAGVVSLTFGTLYFSRHGKGAALIPANAVQLGSGAILCAAVTLAFEDVHADWTPTALFTLLWLTVPVSLGAMALFLFMLKRGAAGRVSANFYLTPGVTAVMGWAILGETLAPLALVGLAVASAGVWLVNRAR
jgi:drug/metabolite transporter (DMT)-like permease